MAEVPPTPPLKPGSPPGSAVDPLSLIPAGPEHDNLRAALQRLKKDFPQDYAGLANQPARVTAMLKKDDDQARDDIFQYIVGSAALMQKYGIDKDTANKLILGENEGGMNFSQLKPPPDPDENKTGTAPASGGVPGLRILTDASLQWRRDPKTGKYYAQYKLPGTADQYVLFEADATQIKSLFPTGPPNVTNLPFDEVIKRQNYHFGGSIAEVEGTGSWSSEVSKVISLALDQENLPDWIKKDPAAMAMLWVKVTEKRTDDWFYENIQNLTSFKTRYPSLNKLTGMGLTVGEAVKSFTQFETNLKQLHAAAGFHPTAITPSIVGNMLGKGYDLSYVQNSYATWKRMRDNAPALAAFNQVLVSQGKAALTGADMYKFLQGQAPQDIYDIYEASAIREAATGVGMGDIFTAENALDLALHTAENLSVSDSYQQFAQIAQQALRFRHEINVGKYGIDVDDLIDVSFGRAPRSGKTVADVGEALGRASKEAEAFLGPRINPFTGFTSDGAPQQKSMSRARTYS